MHRLVLYSKQELTRGSLHLSSTAVINTRCIGFLNLFSLLLLLHFLQHLQTCFTKVFICTIVGEKGEKLLLTGV